MRYDYPHLTSKSTVFDVGGYAGEWTEKIHRKYKSNIYIFEPVNRYYKAILRKFKDQKKIHPVHAGLGDRTRNERINIEGVSSSVFKEDRQGERISIVDIKQFLLDQKLKKIDLLKVNIEGGEYELLERVVKTGIVKNIEVIQVQFHDIVPDAEKRMEKIQCMLSKTHRPTYQYWFVWDNWVKK